jgi:DNA-binding IclR family transcriptional regulator
MELRQRIRPILKELASTSEETASLAIFDEKGRGITYIDQIESPRDMTMKLRVGSQTHLHATALGKVIFANLPDDKARDILQRANFTKLTRNTIIDPAEMKEHLNKVRQNGFAVDNEEAIKGASCIAAPVRDHTGQVVAAISISALATNITAENMAEKVELVKQSAFDASSQLGYKPENTD